MEPSPPSKSSTGGVVAVFLSLAVVAIIVFFALTNLSLFSNFFNVGNTVTTLNVSNSSSKVGNLTIGEPSNYADLVNYALTQINNDRATYNLSAVTLSPIMSAQEHAYSMYVNNYFSHWDTQGYKPYMRYSILNGTGAVEENVAYESAYLTFTSKVPEEQAIYNLEHDMMYNDSSCCQNGHRDNILNPYHNRVSIGVMYSANRFYFVEDFENYYINLSSPIFDSSNNNVVLNGTPTTNLNPDSVIVAFDPLPQPLNASTLNSEYQKPYDEGTIIGGAIPCSSGVFCKQFSSGTTVTPSTWIVTSSSINIVFSLNQFLSKEGSGVYTIYLTQNTFAGSNKTESLTSISLFIQT